MTLLFVDLYDVWAYENVIMPFRQHRMFISQLKGVLVYVVRTA